MNERKQLQMISDLEKRMIENAETDWKATSGGIAPKKGQFGRTTILPALFANEWGKCFAQTKVDESGEEYYDSTFNREYRKIGLRLILKGREKGRVPSGFRIGLVGLGFIRPLTVSHFKLEIPYHNIVEEGEIKYLKKLEDLPLLYYFEKGYEINEETRFRLFGTITAKGKQRVIPLGFSLYKIH